MTYTYQQKKFGYDSIRPENRQDHPLTKYVLIVIGELFNYNYVLYYWYDDLNKAVKEMKEQNIHQPNLDVWVSLLTDFKRIPDFYPKHAFNYSSNDKLKFNHLYNLKKIETLENNTIEVHTFLKSAYALSNDEINITIQGFISWFIDYLDEYKKDTGVNYKFIRNLCEKDIEYTAMSSYCYGNTYQITLNINIQPDINVLEYKEEFEKYFNKFSKEIISNDFSIVSI